MSKSLFEFANENKCKDQEEKKSIKDIDENSLKKEIDKYSKLSQKELIKELHNQVKDQKNSGTFNFKDLSNKIEGIKPMLSEEQIKNLDNLLNQIK